MAQPTSQSDSLVCAQGHANAPGSLHCGTCGIPLLELQAELSRVAQALRERAPSFRSRRSHFFTGVGETGCRELADFAGSLGASIPGASYLMVEPGREVEAQLAQRLRGSGSAHPSAAHQRFLYQRFQGTPWALTYSGTVERLAREDPSLEDSLRRAGLQEAVGHQSVFLLADLDSGLGSGAGPYLLEAAKSINPLTSCFATVTLPSAEEADAVHFNAFYGVARLLRSGDARPADVILLMDADRLQHIRGVGRAGQELAGQDLIPYIVSTLMGIVGEGRLTGFDPEDLVSRSRAMGIQALVPCLAIGRSLEIFGSFTNILESAAIYPLAQADPQTALLVYLLVKVPSRLRAQLPQEQLEREFNRWASQRFPASVSRPLQVFYSEERSDRLDTLLLLGGTSTEDALAITRGGFDRFKAFLNELGEQEWGEYGLSAELVKQLEQSVDGYHTRLTARRRTR